MHISKGLLNKFYFDASDLMLTALGDKFLNILGDKTKALKLLKSSINSDFCFAAHDESALLGLLAFQTKENSFFSISLKNFISVYDLWGGIKRALKMSLLNHKPESREIYIEAIAVSNSYRNKGIGSQLIEALTQYAMSNGFQKITLEVIKTNPKAMALYKRLGFTIVKEYRIWPINKFLNLDFQEIILMEKQL